MDKEVRKLIQAITPIPGVTVEVGGKHARVLLNERLVTVLPQTPSDHRWRDNAIAELRRKGITPGKPKDDRLHVDHEMTQAQLRAALAEMSQTRGHLRQLAIFTFEEVGPMIGITPWPTFDACYQALKTFAHGSRAMTEPRFILASEGLRMWRQRQVQVQRAKSNGHGTERPAAAPAAKPETAEAAPSPPEAQKVHVTLDVATLNALLGRFGLEVRIG